MSTDNTTPTSTDSDTEVTPLTYPDVPDPPTPERPRTPSRSRRLPALYVGLGVIVAATLLMFVFSSGGPALTSAEAGATAEAKQFATAQVERLETRAATGRTSTAVARVTGTAETIAGATEMVRENATATAAAFETAQAPATHTAAAQAFEDEAAQARTAVTALEKSATLVYGPTSGTLQHKAGGEPTCAESGQELHDFIASARFSNPFPASDRRVYDYGIAFSNEGDETHYAAIVTSLGKWSFRLEGDAFYIAYGDETDLLDLSTGGSNTLKLYVSGNLAYVYLNDRYLVTQDLNQLNLNQTRATTHVPMVCTNMTVEDSDRAYSTRFEDFTVWSLP
jgi:hypothetical protein